MIKGSSIRLRVYRSTIAAAAAAAALVSSNVGLAATSSATPVQTPHITSAVPGNGSVTLTWTPASGQTSSGWTIIYIPVGGGPYKYDYDVSGDYSATSETTTGLTNGQQYTAYVEETIGGGATTVDSPGVLVTPGNPATAPATPTGVTAVAGHTSASLSWTAPDNGGSVITGYLITYTDTTNGAGSGTYSTTGTGTTATVPSLTPGHSYTFTVAAINTIGTGTASVASNSITTTTAPGAPTGLTATAVTTTPGNAKASLSWVAPTTTGGTPITGYTISYTDTSNGARSGSATPSGTGTTAIVQNLFAGDTYTFTVSATNLAGTGSASSSAGPVTASTVPGVPTSVTATAGTTLATVNQATVAWTAPTDLGGLAVSGYTISYTDTTSSGHNGTFASSGPGTSAVVTGLRPGDVYTFTVTATNADGAGGASAASSGATPVNVPGTPTGISSTAGPGGSQAILHWTAPPARGSAITGYTIEAIDTSDPSGDSDQSTTVGASATSGTVGGLVPGDLYTLRVIATNAVGDSVPSHASNVVTPFSTPGVPTSLLVTGDVSAADLSWDAPDDGGSTITGYLITYTDAANPEHSGTYASSGTDTSATVSGLLGGESYTFTVAAINAAGTGSPSDPSGSVDVVSAPDAPTGVTATAGPAGSQATITWTAPEDIGGSAITGYTVTLDDGVDPVVTVNALSGDSSAVADGLVPGASYTVTVVAINALGSSSPAGAEGPVTAYTTPDAPTAVTGSRGNGTVDLTWAAPADGGSSITDYTITYTDTTNSAGSGSYNTLGTATSATVPALTNGDSYTFTVTAVNAAGLGTPSAASGAVTPATIPGTVSGVTATADSSSVDLSWDAPTDDGGAPILTYDIAYTDTTNPAGNGTYDSTVTSTNVPGLIPGDSYTFTVTAVNNVGSGSASDPSSPVSPYTTPGTPSGVTATADGSSVDLSWTAPADGGSAITGYVVTYTDTTDPTGSGLYDPTGTGTSATVPDLVPGHSYTFTVTAINAAGYSGTSDPSGSVTTYSTPDAPSAVVASRGNTQVDLSWTAPADNGSAITDYVVTYTDLTNSGGSGSYDTSGTGTSATVTGLTNGDSYTFTVTATNAGGSGSASDPSSAVTPATTPDSPTDVSATADAGSVDLSWDAPADDGGAPILTYDIAYTDTTNPAGNGTYDSTVTSTNVPELIPGDSYTFTVTAVNNVGSSSASDASSPVSPYTTPDAPSGVTSTAGSSSADVSWTAPADGGSAITGYVVTYTDTTDPTGSGLYDPTGTGTSATVPDLVPGDSYTFTVTAINAAGYSGTSDPSGSVTVYTTPDAPTDVTVSRGNASVDVSWTARGDGGSSVTDYVVTYTDTTNSAGSGSYDTLGTSTSATVPNLTNGDSYIFTVAAVNAAGAGTPSAASGAVTPATIPGTATDLTATADGASRATVSWTAPADGGSAITGYGINYTDTDTAVSQGTFSAGTGTSVTIANLIPGDHYTFTVTAVNSVGDGPTSSSFGGIQIITTAGAPTGVTAANSADGAPLISFTAPASDGFTPITSYTIGYADSTHPDGIRSLTGVLSSPVRIPGLQVGDQYYFVVVANNAAGPGANSDVIGPVTVFGAPGAPTAVTATAGTGTVTARWGAPADTGASPVTGYTVTYTDRTNPAHTLVHHVGGGVQSDEATLIAGESYSVSVTATTAYGSGPASPGTPARTPYTVPTPPTALTAAAGNGTAALRWAAPASTGYSPITGYRITVTDRTTHTTRVVLVGTGVTATVGGLSNGDQYTFTVAAVNAAGASKPSQVSAAVTPMLPLAMRSATLLPAVGIGLSATLAPFSVTLNRPGAISVSLVVDSTVLDSTTVAAGGTTVSGNVRMNVTKVAQLGTYSWVVRDATTGAVLGRSAVTLKQNAFLAIVATRKGSSIDVLGVAKWASLGRNAVLPYAGKTIEIQRYTADGWVTIGTRKADGKGHVDLTLTIAQRVGLRLVIAGTPVVVGVTSNVETL